MKKALVLSLALLASVTFGATLELWQDGKMIADGGDILPDTAASVRLVTTGATVAPALSYGVELANVSGVSFSAAADQSGYSNPINYLITPEPTVDVNGDVVQVNTISGSLNTAAFLGGYTPQNGILYEISFTPVNAGSTLTITQLGQVFTDAEGAAADFSGVNIVPEPMTMALLGLGGMLIRRKK
jgi:hypothetical protein